MTGDGHQIKPLREAGFGTFVCGVFLDFFWFGLQASRLYPCLRLGCD